MISGFEIARKAAMELLPGMRITVMMTTITSWSIRRSMRVFLVRHGESLGNLDGNAYREYGDHNVPLSEWGYRQALEAGRAIAAHLDHVPFARPEKLDIWHSPFLRTRQSKDALLEALPVEIVGRVREDYLLREQDFGLFTEIYDHAEQKQKFPDEFEKWARLRSNSGKFYARPPDGESRADVAQRVRLFIQTMMHEASQGHDTIAIVGHGVTNRAFEMNFLQHTVEWFERSENPGNADITVIQGSPEQSYTATLLHQAADRQLGKNITMRGAHGADVTMVPKSGGT